MTTLHHSLPFAGASRQTRDRGMIARATANDYVRLFAVLVVIAAGVALFVVGIGFVLDTVVPLIFGDELRALAALFPRS